MRIIIEQKNVIKSYNYDNIILSATEKTLSVYNYEGKLLQCINYKYAKKEMQQIPFTNDDFLFVEDEEENKWNASILSKV